MSAERDFFPGQDLGELFRAAGWIFGRDYAQLDLGIGA